MQLVDLLDGDWEVEQSIRFWDQSGSFDNFRLIWISCDTICGEPSLFRLLCVRFCFIMIDDSSCEAVTLYVLIWNINSSPVHLNVKLHFTSQQHISTCCIV